jgi:hypothetical protein
MNDETSTNLVDILGNEIKPGDICIFSVRGWGMELGVFIKETPKRLSFRIPCWWCIDKHQYSVSAINKHRQQQKVVVLKDPWFYLDRSKIMTLLSLKDFLITKGILSKEDDKDNKGQESEE